MITAFLSQYLPKVRLKSLAYGLLITLPVITYVFKFSLLYRHGIFQGEDWDYFAQNYEAARISIVHFHQFPWWNSWQDGGQPLFANPQFGLFSIQMPLVLLFGTIAGLHYSVLAYFIIGFWGIYLLLQRVGSTSKLITIPLSYIWTFSGFNAWHIGQGHYTFVIYLLAPWAFLTALNIHKKRGWILFGLVMSLMILTATHYLTIEVLVMCAVIAATQIIKQLNRLHARSIKSVLPILNPYIFAMILIVLLCGARLYYTLQFTHEYPRLEPLDPPESLKLFIASITFRHPVDPSTLTHFGASPYGWIEYGDYFGLATLGLFSYLIISRFEKIKSINFKEWFTLIGVALVGLISFGAFASWSPFSILHHLPLFNQMRVPSRFIGWFVLGIILFLAKLPRKPVIYILLIISVFDVFTANYSIINQPEKPYNQPAYVANQFEQYEFFQADPSLGQLGVMGIQNLRLLRVTQENYGEIYGYEPILNMGEYYYLPGTTLCGIKQSCNFVLTKNAVVTSWSPLKITLKRTGSGPIKLDMNPGKVWYANGKALFPTYRVLEQQKDFVINSQSQKIDISFSPKIR